MSVAGITYGQRNCEQRITRLNFVRLLYNR